MNKSNLRPMQFPGLIRIGRPDADGGYVIPQDLIQRSTYMLSFGLSLDWTFDADFRQRNPKTRFIGVDHTVGIMMFFKRFLIGSFKVLYYSVRANETKREQYREWTVEYTLFKKLFGKPNRHLKKMVAGTSGSGKVTLPEVMQMIPRTADHDVFLKMDIEGSEYEVISDILKHQQRINGLAVEFHNIQNGSKVFSNAMDLLSEHFHVVHIHGNNWGNYSAELDFPDCVEITLVNKSLFTEPPIRSTVLYPRAGLDVPCRAGYEDYVLNFD